MKHSGQSLPSLEHWQTAGFGLYVHWPFCQSKCPYCDFNSHVTSNVDHSVWSEAFAMEMERLRLETGSRPLASIFFGGGTPSLMDPATVETVISEAGRHWPFANDIEITLEANPTSVEREKFTAFRSAGVNRVSVGVQSLNDLDLRRLGRLHGAKDALAAVDMARSVFDRVSFDLIYARQDQSLDAWESELRLALSFEPDHLSLYQLTIEPGTVFGERFSRGQLKGLPTDDASADMYTLTQDLCEAHGLPAYETSNHARPGRESRHNLIYWRSGDFAAIGPGAHGRLTFKDGQRYAIESARAPGAWLNRVQTQACGESSRDLLSTEDKANEFMVMGLRLTEGIDLAEMAAFSAHTISATSIQSLEDLNLITKSNSRIQVTREGRILLNSILAELDLISLEG